MTLRPKKIVWDFRLDCQTSFISLTADSRFMQTRSVLNTATVSFLIIIFLSTIFNQ